MFDVKIANINPLVKNALLHEGIQTAESIANIESRISGVSSVGWQQVAIELAKELVIHEGESCVIESLQRQINKLNEHVGAW
jgi:hypothetical protein